MYLSRPNRDNAFIMLVLWERMTNWLETPNNQLNKEAKKNLKTGATYLFKAWKSLEQDCDKEFGDRLYKQASRQVIELHDKLAGEKSMVTIPVDQFDEISNQALYMCQVGNLCVFEDDFHKCKTHKAFMECAVPPAHCEKGTTCPYRLETKMPLGGKQG